MQAMKKNSLKILNMGHRFVFRFEPTLPTIQLMPEQREK